MNQLHLFFDEKIIRGQVFQDPISKEVISLYEGILNGERSGPPFWYKEFINDDYQANSMLLEIEGILTLYRKFKDDLIILPKKVLFFFTTQENMIP